MSRKYHIHPPTGKVSICRAQKGKCPFGSPEEHYDTATEAMKAYEEKLSPETFTQLQKAAANHHATLQALSSSLKWEGKAPEWLEAMGQKEQELFGENTARVIDVIEDTPLGPLAVVYQKNTIKKNSTSIELERGFAMPIVTLQVLESGATAGYVVAAYVDDKSIARSWGDDEWTSLDYAEEYMGSSVGMRRYATSRLEDPRKVRTITGAETPEELLAAKQKLWASGFAAFNTNPPGFDMTQLSWGSLVNLKPDHAPAGEKLDADLKVLQTVADKNLEDFKHDHGQATIDFSRMEETVDGKPGLLAKGYATSLYVYTARMLAEEGQSLRASTTQSDSAQLLWTRMARNRELPIAEISKLWSKSDRETKVFVLDFTPDQEATKKAIAETQSLKKAKAAEDARRTEELAREQADELDEWGEE